MINKQLTSNQKHYLQILKFFFSTDKEFDKNTNNCLSLTKSHISEICLLCNSLSKKLNLSLDDCKQSILKAPALLNTTEPQLILTIKTIKDFLKTNYISLSKIFQTNPWLFTLPTSTIKITFNNLLKQINCSQTDLIKILQHNNIENQSPETIVEKLKTLTTLFNLTSYQAIALCDICGVLNYSIEELKQTKELIVSLNAENNVFNCHTLFDCSYQENTNKLNILKILNCTNALCFISNINSNELNNRLAYIKTTCPLYSSNLILLPDKIFKQVFVNYSNKKANLFEKYAKRNTNLLKENKKNIVFENISKSYSSQFPIQIGKKSRIKKDDKEFAKLACLAMIKPNSPFKKAFTISYPIKQTHIDSKNNFASKIEQQLKNKHKKRLPY